MTLENLSPNVRLVSKEFWKAALDAFDTARREWLHGFGSDLQALDAYLHFAEAVRFTDVIDSTSEYDEHRVEANELARLIDLALRDGSTLYAVIQHLASARFGGDDLRLVREVGYENYARRPGACAYPGLSGPWH